VIVPGLADATQLAMGSESRCALTRAGTVKCWGGNEWNEFGAAGPRSSVAPVTVPGIADATALSMSRHSACVIRRDGEVWCWGSVYGTAPRRITAVEHATELHCSGSYSDVGEHSVMEIDNIACIARQSDGVYVSWSLGGTPDDPTPMQVERDDGSRAWPHVTLQRSDEYDEGHLRCFYRDDALQCGDPPVALSRSASSAMPGVAPAATAGGTTCVISARADFHLRPAAVRASIGTEFPAGTRVEILSSETMTRGTTRLFGVRIVSDGAPENGQRGFMFLATEEVPAGCPPTARR
jgi:hypothetical protein